MSLQDLDPGIAIINIHVITSSYQLPVFRFPVFPVAGKLVTGNRDF